MSERRIDKVRYDRVMFSRVCPGCGDYVVVDVARRSRSDAMDANKSKYLGTFHCCGGPDGHMCWNMTKFDASKPNRALYETFGEAFKIKLTA